MKWLIYLLLICNIGFVAWHYRGLDMTKDDGANIPDINYETQLVLLSEPHDKPKITENNKPPLKDKLLCYSLGPFTKKFKSEKARHILAENDVETKSIRLRDNSERGFWVILPASASRKEANTHISRLKKLKVKDYFLVATGSHENAVSLGVYSQKKFARKRVDEIIRLGFVPRMESVTLPQKVYWLNWNKDAKIQPGTEIIENLKKQFPQISKIDRSCK